MNEQQTSPKKNVLVAGGAGFIGSFLCERLLSEGCRVICVDSLVSSSVANIQHLLKYPDFAFVKQDVSAGLDLAGAQELARFELQLHGLAEVYHLACPMSIRNFEANRMTTLKANSLGTFNLLELAREHRARFFLASTSVIYGQRPEDDHQLTEGEAGRIDHLSPRACYDEGRRWVETMAYTYREVHGLDVRIARIFRTFGPRMPLADGHMLPDFVVNALESRPLVIYGDENFRSSFLYVTDAVDGIARLMRLPVNPGIVNLGSDYDVKLRDIAARILELTGSSSPVVHEAPLPFLSDLGLPDLTRAKGELGWIALVSLDQGLKKLVEYTVANRNVLSAGLAPR
jgi:UDP-glucuronate decarboxylase